MQTAQGGFFTALLDSSTDRIEVISTPKGIKNRITLFAVIRFLYVSNTFKTGFVIPYISDSFFAFGIFGTAVIRGVPPDADVI